MDEGRKLLCYLLDLSVTKSRKRWKLWKPSEKR